MIQSALLLLGGNIGDVEENLKQAVELLAEKVGEVTCTSQIYTTPAWGFESEELFLNQAVEVLTTLEPIALLDSTQAIEQQLGRNFKEESLYKEQTKQRYAPRVIDVDIILLGDETFDSQRITIPHSQMAHREFVLRPLCEIAPHRLHPITGETIEMMLSGVLNSRPTFTSTKSQVEVATSHFGEGS